MQYQQQSRNPRNLRNPRIGGLGLVALIHAVMIWALVTGFIREPGKTKPPPLVLQPQQPTIEREPEPPPPPRLLPKQQDIPPIYVSVPEFPVDAPPPQQPLFTTNTQPAAAPTGPREVSAAPLGSALPGSAPAQAVTSPGLVCTKMGKPELPALNWSGEAVLKAVATVHAGRVVNADVRLVSGSADPRTRRALQAAVASALQQSYDCPGNHVFEQEFFFRVE